ncbi:c-type cytochrome [Alkalisalibacterium limincola]
MATLEWNASIALATCLLVLLHAVPVQASSGTPTALEVQGDAAAGEPLYQRHCAACHGPAGRGDGQQGRASTPVRPTSRPAAPMPNASTWPPATVAWPLA